MAAFSAGTLDVPHRSKPAVSVAEDARGSSVTALTNATVAALKVFIFGSLKIVCDSVLRSLHGLAVRANVVPSTWHIFLPRALRGK
jgi:phage tail protein X